ncbi:MAG: valine--tRNA ligase, partial [Terracidiphilus sp.]
VQLDMLHLQSFISDIRALRKDRNVPEKETVPVELNVSSAYRFNSFMANIKVIRALAKVTDLKHVSLEEIKDRPGIRSGNAWTIDVIYEAKIDIPAERERLTKEIAKYEKGLASAERQLGNEAFLKKAPPQVVEGLKKQEAETRLLLEKAQAALKKLSEEE